MEKILIVRLGAMGDVIHALSAVHALRQSLPQATIDWAIEEKWAELLCAKNTSRESVRSPQKPLVDKVRVLDTKRWRKEIVAHKTRQAVANLRRQLKEENYDLAIDVQGSAKSAVLTQLSGAKRRFGYESPRESLAKLFYSETVRNPAECVHVIQQAEALVREAACLTLPPQKWRAEGGERRGEALPCDVNAEAWVNEMLIHRGIADGKFAIMNPGAGWGAKQWPAERYGQVASALAEHGIKTLVNVAPEIGEKQLAATVEEASKGRAKTITCSIGELIALTRRASLFVGGDTGPMHLAAFLGVPVVALFGPTDPARNGPYYSPHAVLRSERSVTSYSHGNEADPGLISIGAQEVIASARKLLS